MDDISELRPATLPAQTVDTGESKPFNCPPRRTSPKQREVIDSLVSEMFESGYHFAIKEPMVISFSIGAEDRRRKPRVCVDYRELNDRTVKDRYPLPRIDDTLDAVGGSAYYSNLDLKCGYWQVPLEKESRAKTSFATGGKNGDLWEGVQRPSDGILQLGRSFSMCHGCCFGRHEDEICPCLLGRFDRLFKAVW
jgi:hypothetical protein